MTTVRSALFYAKRVLTCTVLLGHALFAFAQISRRFDFDERHIGDRVIDAVNCGGEEHVDINGVRYRRDALDVGVASDFGKRLIIQRVHEHDQPLFQTERYAHDDLTYELQLPKEEAGDFVLVLKFSEVYFDSSGQKVFDVRLNDQHDVLTQLDIFAMAGRANAHEEYVPFTVDKQRNLQVYGESSKLKNANLRVTFVKGAADNPKINALYVMRGGVSDVPQMATAKPQEEVVQDEDDHVHEEEVQEVADGSREKVASGRRTDDPYDTMDLSQMFLPILIALACFFPILYCLCKV